MPDSKPRLLVLTSTYPRWAGDSEPGFVHELSRRLATEFEVHVLAPHAPGAAISEQLDGVRVHRFRYAPGCLEQLAYEGGITERLRQQRWRVLLVPVMLICQFLASWRMVWRLSPSVVHAHWVFPQAFVAVLGNCFRIRQVPILCTVHGADWYRLRGRFWKRVNKWSLSRCKAIAPVSDVLFESIRECGSLGEQLTEPMPMGIRIPDKVKPLSVRDPQSFFFVGRLVPKKGLGVLLEALALVRQQGLRFSLRIAGGGEGLPGYQKRVGELNLGDCVTFLGAVSQDRVYEEMERSAICIVPSLEAEDGDREGLGLVVLEALACGCRLVASDIQVFKSLLNGIEKVDFFTAGDGVALARELANQVLEKKPGLSESIPRVVQEYAWPQVAHRYALKLQELS